jgi:hypothetical protein
MTHLPLNGAQISAGGLEEDARAIRLVPENRRFAMRHLLDRFK